MHKNICSLPPLLPASPHAANLQACGASYATKSRSQLNIITNTLGSAESAYSHDCADLKHLSEAMARHVCDKYRHVDPVRFPH